ncbi:hypothetical protein Dimus_001129, partial [Dionaea muscipula]
MRIRAALQHRIAAAASAMTAVTAVVSEERVIAVACTCGRAKRERETAASSSDFARDAHA